MPCNLSPYCRQQRPHSPHGIQGRAAAPPTDPPAHAGLDSEDGFVLIATLVVLVLLVLLGISSTTNTGIELQIASNDKVGKQTFYRADGGLDLASELLEQNIACPEGFGAIDLDTDGANGNDYLYDAGDDSCTLGYDANNLIKITNRAFWQKSLAQSAVPSDTVRDFFSPANASATAPHTNFDVGGDTRTTAGGSLQMAAGYEGVGKSAASGGADILYNVYSQRKGDSSSQATLLIQWRHRIGQEEDCRYAP